jgi:hypothetical protein
LERNKSGSRRCSSLSIAQSKKFFEGYGWDGKEFG